MTFDDNLSCSCAPTSCILLAFVDKLVIIVTVSSQNTVPNNVDKWGKCRYCWLAVCISSMQLAGQVWGSSSRHISVWAGNSLIGQPCMLEHSDWSSIWGCVRVSVLPCRVRVLCSEWCQATIVASIVFYCTVISTACNLFIYVCARALDKDCSYYVSVVVA